MNLRDAMRQVEREQPHLTGTAKLEAIKALRAQPKPADPEPEDRPVKSAAAKDEDAAREPATVGEAWGLLIFIAVGMQLAPWVIWGSLESEPRWYDVLHAALLIAAFAELVSAYRRRGNHKS